MKDKATKIYLIGTWRDFGAFGERVYMRVVGYYTDLETAKKCIEENPDEVVTQVSICYNVENLITILNCIDINRKEIFDMVNDP